MTNVILIIITLIGVANAETPLCGTGWVPYENEKCLKFFENAGLITYESAEEYCSLQENSSLIFIHSEIEQVFISNFLFKTNNIVDTVWIGAKKSSTAFKWADSSNLTFTYWADGSPNNKANYDCVQMMPDSTPPGKWVNEPCNKNNAVMCQTMQIWSLNLMQKNIQELTRRLNNIEKCKVEPIPVGFIYSQLPKQPEPKQLWPDFNWQDISSEYSGHFFRVVGGNADKFGTSQIDAFQGHEHETPNFIFNETSYGGWYTSGTSNSAYSVRLGVINPPNTFQHSLSSNGFDGNPRNASETRPLNYSIRIWKRIL